MRKILVFVQSLDGKITKWGNPVVRSWSSREDQEYFSELMKQSTLTVIGNNTFKVDRTKPRVGHLLVVMTRQPEKYSGKNIPGQLEFTGQSPSELVDRFSKQGFEQLLMVGGPQTATAFLKELQIDEIWLTVEPAVFGAGYNFVTEEELDIELRLLSAHQLNPKGTMLLKYAVIK